MHSQSRLTLLALVASISLTLPARAERLWVEKSAEDARKDQVVVPSMAPLIKTASQAVVNISTLAKGRAGPANPMEDFFRQFNGGGQMPQQLQRGLGTGFVITKDGYILTNAHVVEDASNIEVRFQDDDTPRKAKVIGADPTTDLALIKIEATNLALLPLGDSEALEVGDFVVAIGNPFGLDHSASFGMISAKGRKDINPSGRAGLYDFIQTDAAINPGNSGGPLLNLKGEVVGINAAVNAAGQGLGFAIPINMAKALIPELKEKGRVTRSWLGVGIQRVTPELAQSFGMDTPRGALVSNVVDDSPGARAGLEPGDVITEFDGKRVVHSNDLPLMAATAGVGKAVTLTYMRDGKPKSAKVTLLARPDDSQLARAGSAPGVQEEMGIKVSDLNDETRQQLGLNRGFKGVLVKDVDGNGPAAEAGLQHGDVVVKVNGKGVEDAASFMTLARGIKKGQTVRFFVRRGDSGMFVAFRV